MATTGFELPTNMTTTAAAGLPGRRLLPLIFALTLIWGSTWVLFGLAVREVSVWTFRAFNLTGAGLLLLSWCWCTGQSIRVPRRDRMTLVASGLIYLGIWNIASTYAAVMIPSGQAAILGFTMPLWAALGSRWFFGERLDGRSTLAVVIGGIGVLLLVGKGLESYAAAPLGFALGLTAGAAWAGGTLVLKRRPVSLHGAVIAGWQMLIVGIPFGCVALVKGSHEWFMPSWTTIAVIAYITVVPLAFGNAIWFTIVNRVPTHIAALSPVLVPVVALLTGAWLLGEPLGLLEFAAMTCCVAGLALNMRR